jgi:Ni,Fe-hydrogenase III small subunit
MSDKPVPLRIYNFSHPLIATEILSLQGDKYNKSLPFSWTMTDDFSSADVIAWDGVITPKNQAMVRTLVDSFQSGKILLLLGESMTLMRDHPLVSMIDLTNLNYIELAGWSVLPEEILAAFEACREKLQNV